MLHFAVYASIVGMQLRQKLFLVLSLMAMVPLLVLLFQVVARVEDDLEKRTSAELQKTLSKMSEEIATLMQTQESLARGLAKVPVVKEFGDALELGDPNVLARKASQLGVFFLNYQSTVPSIQAIRFTDVHGKTLVKVREGTLIPPREEGSQNRSVVEDIAYKPFFKHALASHQRVSVSDFERGKVAGETEFCPAMVRYSVPIRDGVDTLQGLLTINMWGRRIDDAVQAALGGYPGQAYIAEINDNPARDGIFLYHENPNWRFANQLGTRHRLSTELGPVAWDAIRTGPRTGMVEAPNDRLLFYRKYAPYPDRDTQWLLVIETARKTVLAPVSALRNWIGYLIAAVLIVSLIVARWAAARLARPVHDLAQIITRYADGDKQARYEDGRRDEIGAAGRAFNYLSSGLERATQERQKAERAARQSERLAAIGQMAAGIGHEINNPLMNMMSLATLVEESLPASQAQAREDLAALQQEGKRCAQIVQGILNFARENRPQFRRFDLARLIDDTVALLRHRLRASSLTVEGDLQRPLMLIGDERQLQQVLVNLLLNAIDASPTNRSIEIAAKRAGDVVTVEIRDSGSGLLPEVEAQVFDPFFTTKPEGAGTGLGLSVSYGIINKHGGTISLENLPRGGVRALVTLPAGDKADLGEGADTVALRNHVEPRRKTVVRG